MSSFKSSRFGKRLRAAYEEIEREKSPERKRRRIDHDPLTSSPSSRRIKVSPRATVHTDSPHGKGLDLRNSFAVGDRFIPYRENRIQASHLPVDKLEEEEGTSYVLPDPIKDRANDLYNSLLRSELTSSTSTPHRIFTYHSPRRSLSESRARLEDPSDNIYQLTPLRKHTRKLLFQPRLPIREVARVPYRIIHAPNISDDFYTSLMDWSPSGTLAIGLRQEIFLLRVSESEIVDSTALCLVPGEQDCYSALAWMQTSPILALATYDGHLEVRDASTGQLVRSYQHAHGNNRIGAISWTSHVFSSGSGDHSVKHWDYRDKSTKPFHRLKGHNREVCGVKWNTDGGVHTSLLASGGIDEKVCIWDLRSSTRECGSTAASNTVISSLSGVKKGSAATRPLYEFKKHTSAVKALAWNPHHSGVLASGGGFLDRCIRMWNTTTGTMMNEVDTSSQVCNLVWSANSQELVSTHGYATTVIPNQICIWKYPTMSRVSCLHGHGDRVQHAALSPDGNTLVTGSSDQSLQFWSIFPHKTQHKRDSYSMLDYGKLIR